jgi:endonuclease G
MSSIDKRLAVWLYRAAGRSLIARRRRRQGPATMPAPANEFAFDPEIARDAARRWKSEATSRNKKIKARDAGHIDKAESKARIGKRVKYLLDKVQEMKGAGEPVPGPLESMLSQAPRLEHEADAVMLERVIGETRDFLAIEFLEGGIEASRSVGRIVTRLSGNRSAFGTGFMVSPNLLMTNHHVLKTAAIAELSTVDFNFQFDRFGQPLQLHRFALRPEVFFLNDKDLDFALVALSGDKQERAPFGFRPLIPREGKILIGDPVNIVQHPKGEAKQIVVRENRLLDLPNRKALSGNKQELDQFAYYEADTEPGSSGSPVFNDQWDVIALHHSGVPKTDAQGRFLDIDGKLWKQGEDDPARLAWVGNEGIRVSRLVNFIKGAPVKEHEKPLRDEFLEVGANPTSILSRPESSSSVPVPPPRRPGVQPQRPPRIDHRGPDPSLVLSSAPSPQAASVQFTVPLTVTITLGAPAAAVASAVTAVSSQLSSGVALEAVEQDPDWESRKGFNPGFLGVPVPMPKPVAAIEDNVVALDHGGHELKYHHYSVIMNKERRLAFVSAVNIDVEAEFQHRREKGDKWFFDPRIDRDLQAGPKFYSGNPLDRGHLTRRDDAAWGHTEDEAKLANDDTFHWTNCAPQHEIFNQSTKAEKQGLLLWGTLENHISEQAASGSKKLCVFNGPIFRDGGSQKDPEHRGLLVPREFWKVIAYLRDNGKLGAVGFVLSQDSLIKDLPEEEFVVGPYRPFQVKIRDIMKRTRLDFGDLHKHDPLEQPGVNESFEDGTEAVALSWVKDIVL